MFTSRLPPKFRHKVLETIIHKYNKICYYDEYICKLDYQENVYPQQQMLVQIIKNKIIKLQQLIALCLAESLDSAAINKLYEINKTIKGIYMMLDIFYVEDAFDSSNLSNKMILY